MSSPLHSLKHKSSNTTEKGLGRAQDILLAARALLAAEGYAGLSMRRVAAAAGMSLSNVQHYYQSKDALLEAVLQYTMEIFQAKIDGMSAGMGTRAEQFLSTIDMLMDDLSDPVIQATFFEIRALGSRHAFASALMDKMLGRERKAIYLLIRGMNPAIDDEQYRLRAILIVAQVEGLMLFRLKKNDKTADYQALRAALHQTLLNLAMVP